MATGHPYSAASAIRMSRTTVRWLIVIGHGRHAPCEKTAARGADGRSEPSIFRQRVGVLDQRYMATQ